MDLKIKSKSFPDNPGIYLFYNSKKELIYVGKATSLRNRVHSYFRYSDHSPLAPLYNREGNRPIEAMIHEVQDIKTIQTDSVLEAIILEANYIKKFQPKYNVDLKDDKSWVHICITKDEYPKVVTVREHELKNFQIFSATAESRLHSGTISNFQYDFGPYPGLKTREMMKLLRKLFYISDCQSPVGTRHGAFSSKPCFYRQIGQCLGVCTGEISPQDYNKKVIRPLVQFLSGRKKSLLKNLENEMKLASKNHEFEEAGRLRDQIWQLNRIQDIALLNKNFVEDNFKFQISNFKFSRIEGYDISNLGSSNMVGSMVVFDQNGPIKSEYRKFKIKNVVGQSDVDCLGEVLERRLNHLEWKLPDVILVDGGLSQVNAVCKVIKLKSYKVPVIGIAKGPERKKNEFILGEKNRNFIKWVNENRNLLIQVRDEAHRFAIAFHRQRRGKMIV